MNSSEFYQALQKARSVAEIEDAIAEFKSINEENLRWFPVGGRENNKGTIEVSGDPARALVERLTNGIDAILDSEHEAHKGIPTCKSPKEAAAAWLNIPESGLSEMTPTQRRNLSQRVTITVLSGEGKDSRIVEVRDLGTGLTPEQIPHTILSLNESNKMQKHYLAGAYGQGGSSTFAVSKYTVIASKSRQRPIVGFTVVRFEDLPPEEYKIGRYVYLTLDNAVLALDLPDEEFPVGTSVKHFGYDLSNYSSSFGPTSLYGLLNQVLFDPVLPIWLDSYEVHNQRRVIKGSRNALNGAVDEGDEGSDDRRGPKLSHHARLFYTTLGEEFGRIGIEYWVWSRPVPTKGQLHHS